MNSRLRDSNQIPDVLYTRFINTLSQQVDVRALLLLGTAASLATEGRGEAGQEPAERPHMDFLFEPNLQTVMDRLVIYFLDFRVGQMLLEAKASEHSARMVAMKNANGNAHQLIKHLTLEYNKLRQANITKELLEISSAAMALG